MTDAETTTSEATPRQAEVLDYIRDFRRRHGFSPTIREMCRKFGFRSPNGALAHLKALVQKGLLHAPASGGSRQWVPAVGPGCCPCCGRPLPEARP